MTVYKTEEGKETVREAVRELYSSWPIPAESVRLNNEEFGKTHVLDMGPKHAPPLVLLHGSGSNSASWMGYAPEWAKRFRVVAVDIPGQPGLSDDRRPSLEDGSMRMWLESVAEELRLGRFFLCGMSLGGWIALDYTIAYPDRAAGVCCITASGIVPPKAVFFLRILPLMLLGDWGTKRINRIVHGPVPVDPAVDRFGCIISRHYRQMRDPIPIFSDEQLSSIICPVLYIGGAEDALLDTASAARRLQRLVPDIRIHIAEGGGHVILDRGPGVADFFGRILS